MSEKINALDAAKIYIVAELSRIFSRDEAQGELKRGIDGLSEKEIWRLLEALSFNYRLNGLFECLSDEGYTWRTEEVEVGRIELTRMNPAIDAVTHSAAIQNNSIKFRDYLLKYFEEHPNDDPKHLGQFRPSGRPIQYPIVFLKEVEGKLKLLDGSNRFVAKLLSGDTTVAAIIGTKTKEGKPKFGDSIFLRLRKIHEKSNAEEKASIVSVVKKLMQESADGRNAVEVYWVQHAKTEEMKREGEKLLEQ